MKIVNTFFETAYIFLMIIGSSTQASAIPEDWICCEVGFPFSGGLARVYGSLKIIKIVGDKNRTEIEGFHCFIDKSGQIVLPFLYEQAGDFSEGVAFIGRRDPKQRLRFGFIDPRGSMIIPLQFEEARDFSEGLAAVKRGDLWGYIDRSGKVVIDFRYKNAREFHEGLAAVQPKDGITWDYIDVKGEKKISNGDGIPGSFSEGLVPGSYFTGKQTQHTLMNFEGRHVSKLDHGGYSPFAEGMMRVDGGFDKGSSRSLSGFVDGAGRLVIPCQYEGSFPFSEGVAAVRKNGRWGFIDRFGNVCLPFVYGASEGEFSRARILFREGLAPLNGGYIDKNGKFVIKIGPGQKLGYLSEKAATRGAQTK